MKRKIPLAVCIISISSFLFLGCFGVDGNFRKIRNEIISATNNNFHTDVEVGIGSVGLSLAESIVKMTDADDEAKIILHHVSDVQVGVYRTHGPVELKEECDIISSIDERMKKQGWTYIIKSRDHDRFSIVYIKQDLEEKLREIFVVNLEEKELEIVEVKGDLHKIIDRLVRDKGLEVTYN